MATIKLSPTTYSLSNSSYLSVSNASNMYADTSSTSYATLTHTRSSTTSYYLYLKGFDFDALPADAEVSSYTVRLKIYQTGGNTSTSYRPYLVNNTSTISGNCSVIPQGSAGVIEFTDGTPSFSSIQNYGANFGIRINAKRSSSSTQAVYYIYGAEIEVEYTSASAVPEHNVSISCTNGTTNPSGTVSVTQGESFTLTATPNDGYSLSYMTVNGVGVTPQEVATTVVENGVALFHLDNSLSDDIGGLTATNTGSFNSSTKKFGSHSIYLNGGQYIQINLPQSYANATLECWFNCTTERNNGNYPTLFSTSTNNGSGGTYFHIDDGYYSEYCVCRSNAIGGNNNGGYGNTVVSRNTWHHFAYCRSGSNHHFFLDGVLQRTVTQSNPDAFQTLYIGGLRNGANSWNSGCYMTGYVDEILVSNVCKWTSSFTPRTTPYNGIASTYYTYTVNSVNEDTNIVIVFSNGEPTLMMKVNGTWTAVREVYKKVNGSWVLQTNLQNLFDTNANYVKG